MSISAIVLQEICCITDLNYILLVLIGLKDPHMFQLPDEPFKVLRITLIGLWFRRICLISPVLISDHSFHLLVK